MEEQPRLVIEKKEIKREKDDKGICKKECEVMSRVVGYYRPTRQWHEGKQEEFKHRKTYSEKKSLKHKFKDEKKGDEKNKEKLTAFTDEKK